MSNSKKYIKFFTMYADEDVEEAVNSCISKEFNKYTSTLVDIKHTNVNGYNSFVLIFRENDY